MLYTGKKLAYKCFFLYNIFKEQNMQYDYLVVGAGLFGEVFAHEAKK